MDQDPHHLPGQGWMMYELDGDDMAVEDCIFLSGHETGEWLGGRIKAIKASKTKGMLIRRNIIGLDMGNLSWLATEWQGYANWSNAVGRLNQFKTEQNLPRRMGEMAGGIAIFDGTEDMIDQNIIHLDFDANLAGGMDEDHLIYSLRETKIAITRNWLSGHPNTAGGGLKHRDTWGPGVIAANYLNDAPLLLYSYGDANSTPIDYDYLYPFDNQLIFRIYVLRLTATDGSATVFQDLNVTVIAAPGFASWIGGFNVGSQNGTGDDPDHDGIPNLIEYALSGGDPAQGGTGILPAFSLASDGGNSYLTLTIQKNTTATGITLITETCNDLATWNSSNTIIVSETASTLVVRDAVPVSGSSTRFMRLKVSQP